MISSDGSVFERLRAGVARLGASRAEVAALALLALFGVAALGIVWWAQTSGAGRAASEAGALGDETSGEGLDSSPSEGPVADGMRIERGSQSVVVHVAGLVKAPGLQRLPAGARVADALEVAGGPLPEAWLDALNLARPVADGEQLLVPGRPAEPVLGMGEAGGEVGGGAGADGGSPLPAGIRPDGTVDLNRASAAELETLPGIGPVMAARIVEHRTAQGPFTAVGQLRDVQGIGEKTFQTLVDQVSL